MMLAKQYHSLAIEKKWQEFWEAEGIYRFDPHGEGPIYSIDTPPPTVSGSIHIGHVYSYTHAEIIARFRRMNGYRVFYPFGFDDNGLPTERLVEREQGHRAGDLEREDFNRLCLETTARYEARFKDLWQSLGFSVDWTLEYSTIGAEARRISQLSFLDLYRKGRAYQSQSPVLWCTECQTAIAQAEIETKEIETQFHSIIFQTTAGEAFRIATTRPELIPACAAILVHPADRKHRHLIGNMAVLPLLGSEVPILADDEVDPARGTGVVMCCTFGDQQDIIWWKKHRLPLKEMIDQNGIIKAGFEPYSGMRMPEARRAILADLREAGKLSHQESITHQVAHHERCGEPIEYLTSRQWFIRIMDEKERLIRAADEINWHPAFMKHRYLEWVQNLEWDWSISRQRYFGVPFPIWYCAECGEIITPEADELPLNPLTSKPSRPCSCGSTRFVPERDVMDTWATSSCTPFINAGWNGDETARYPILPMSLRPQAHEIIRTWAFYTIVKSLYHFERIPWQDIMISGYVMASPGEKISKSKGNAKTIPEELISAYSADVIRLWTSQARLGTDIYFTEEEVRNNQRLPIKLWNAARFTLGHLSDFPGVTALAYEPMDQWILAQSAAAQREMTRALEAFEVSQARMILERFFWNDFCDNYLEIVKERLYKPELRGEGARRSAQQALYITLLNLLKLFAIYMPHLTEEIYQCYYRNYEGWNSLHRMDWNRYAAWDCPAEICSGGAAFIAIAAQVRKYKSEQNLSLGSGLAHLNISISPDILAFLKQAAEDLKAVTRAEELSFTPSKDGLAIEVTAG